MNQADSAGGSSERDNFTVLTILGLVLVGLFLVAAGTILATWVSTAGGEITLEETTVETESGLELAATIHRPADVSADNPAPAVTLIHGYTGEQGTMTSFAREFADRGYVAITVDQPGHGHSDPPAFDDGWGGPAILGYAHSLDYVDEKRVAMVGHSMGGFASLAAAETYPDGYESIVMVGSTWGDDGAFEEIPRATTTFPRNLALLFTPYDEFSLSMYGESVPANVPDSEKVRTVFGTDEAVVPGEIYGHIDAGTARWFTAPPTTHTGMHRSTTTIAHTIEWVGLTTGQQGEETSQGWYWATVGHVLTMLGVLLVAIGTTALTWRRLRSRWSDRRWSQRAVDGIRPSRRLRIGLTALPALTIYPLYGLGTAVVPVTRLTPQQLTHGYVLWILGMAVIAVGTYYWRAGGSNPHLPARLSLAVERRTALLAAAVGGAITYLLVVVVGSIPGGGARMWMAGLTVLTPLRWLSLVIYGVPITVGAIAFAFGLDRVLRNDLSGFRRLVVAIFLTSGGMGLFLAVQYAPLFFGFGLPIPSLGPLAIQAIRSMALLLVGTVLGVACNELTDQPLVGGLLAGFVLTWIIVGTSPIHVTIL